MPAIYRNISYLLMVLQGCFTGLLLGLFIQLLLYQPMDSWPAMVAAGLMGSLIFLWFSREKFQRYVVKHISFGWMHYFSSGLGCLLLLLLLPSFFRLQESAWMVSAFQLGSLAVFCLLLAAQFLLEQALLQKAYAGLLQHRASPYLTFFLLLTSLCGFAWLFTAITTAAASSLFSLLQNAFFIGGVLLSVLVLLKWALFRALKSPALYLAAIPEQEKESAALPVWLNNYYLEKNLEEVLLNTEEAWRPQLYQKIREIPLIDKIEVMEGLLEQHLRAEQELSYTLKFLKRLRKEIPAGNNFNEVDRLGHVLAVKACIRTVIAEGNPMLVQKLLSDNRPEVKKAAMLATVKFREASFIPALVNLLKEHEYSFTAKEALQEWGEQCIPFLRSAKYRNKGNSFFMEQCLELVAGYHSPEARDFLVEMLNEPVKQLQYKAALALLKSNYTLTALHKTQILQLTEALVATIATLREIRCRLQDRNSLLYVALLEEETTKRTLVVDLLQAFLPGPVWVQVKKMCTKPSVLAAPLCALLDLFLPLVLRSKCKILLAAAEHENIAPALQAAYHQEQLSFEYASEHDAIRQVLNLDYSQVGPWLRQCALRQLSTMPGQQASLQILGEIFNQNPLMQETAAEVLFTINYNYYYLYLQRLPSNRAKELKHKIGSRILAVQEDAQVNSLLLHDQICYLRRLPPFSDRSYEQLASEVKFFTICSLEQDDHALAADPYRSLGYWIIIKGSFSVLHRGVSLFSARPGDVIDMSLLGEAGTNELGISADCEIKFFFVEKMTYNNLYLKSDYFKKIVFQPAINQLASAQLAYN